MDWCWKTVPNLAGGIHISRQMLCRGAWALPKVCRQIHAQTKLALYADVTFHVYDLRDLVENFWPTGQRETMFNQITESELVNWCLAMDPPQSAQGPKCGLKLRKTCLGIVATQMPGLRELAIKIEHGRKVVLRDLNAEWHLPLHGLRGLQSFTLIIYDALNKLF